jgi:hypothetical protein
MSTEFRYTGNAKQGYHVRHKVSTGNLGSLGHVERSELGTWEVRFTVPPRKTAPGEPQPCSWGEQGRRSGFQTREQAARFLRDEKKAQKEMDPNEYREDRQDKGWMS